MRCQEIQQQLKPYLQGKLEEGFAAQIRQHLAGCARCSQKLALEKALLEWAETSPVAAVPSGFVDEVLEKFTERISAEEAATENLQDLPGFLVHTLVANLKLTRELVLSELRAVREQILEVSLATTGSLRSVKGNIVSILKSAY